MKYLVQWNYKSSLGGPWEAGQVIDQPVQMAEAVERDSPGVLSMEREIASQEQLAMTVPESTRGEIASVAALPRNDKDEKTFFDVEKSDRMVEKSDRMVKKASGRKR
jgi:hypothetical protein